VTLLLNRELVSRVKLRLVSVLPHIVKDCPKIRKLPKIFLRSFENVGPGFHSSNVISVACPASIRIIRSLSYIFIIFTNERCMLYRKQKGVVSNTMYTSMMTCLITLK